VLLVMPEVAVFLSTSFRSYDARMYELHMLFESHQMLIVIETYAVWGVIARSKT